MTLRALELKAQSGTLEVEDILALASDGKVDVVDVEMFRSRYAHLLSGGVPFDSWLQVVIVYLRDGYNGLRNHLTDASRPFVCGVLSTLRSAEAVEVLGSVSAPELFQAASVGDLSRVTQLLASGAEIDACWQYDSTALIESCIRGHLAVARTLVEAGANPNHANENGYTPLRVAAESNWPDLVRFLLDAGGNVHAQDARGRSVIYAAALRANAYVVKALINGGADPNSRCTRSLFTPLMAAAGNQRRTNLPLKSMGYLIDAGADVNARADDGRTAIAVARAVGDPEKVGLLLSVGATE